MQRIGVVGTMVWDTIRRDSDVEAVTEEWGGISYALAAADAIPALDSTIVPIIRIGRDLAERGFDFFRELSCIATDEGIIAVELDAGLRGTIPGFGTFGTKKRAARKGGIRRPASIPSCRQEVG